MKTNWPLALAALIGSGVAHAEYILNVVPGSIRVIGSTGDVAFTPTNTAVVSGCPSNDFYIILSANNSKMMLGVLLTARTTGATVKIYVPDNLPQRCDPGTGRPNVIDITLEN